MSSTKHRVAPFGVLLLALLCVPSSATGQDLCQPTETIARCWDRLLGATVREEQRQAARKTETGLTDINGLSSSVKDFLPLLQLSGVLGAVQKDDQNGAVTVALNTPFLGSPRNADDVDNALQMKAVIETAAKLFEPLKQQLPEQDRAAVEEQLLGAKENAENVTFHVSYNVATRRLGRNFAQHADVLNALFDLATRDVAGKDEALLTRAGQLLKSLTKANISGTLWQDMLPVDRRAVEDLLPGIVAAERAANAGYASRLRQVGLDLYGQLVTNQPQLQITGSRSVRDDLFGPDLFAGRITFEMGLGNSLNAALGEFNGSCAAQATACLARYTAFVNDPRTRAAVRDGSRITLYAEFVQNADYHFTSTDPVLDLVIAEGTGWTAGLDYGRLIAVDETGTAGGRVDASLKWEAPSDETIDRRLVASIVVTKKFGDLSIPFGIVYANKPKFLTGVDRGLTANVGLKFNLFSGLN
jgi:hypothetical protein